MNAVGRVAVRARDVRVRRGARTVLDVHHVNLEPGSLTAIIGPNGAGKSTLLAALAGLRAFEHGGDVRLVELDRDGAPEAGRSLASFSKAGVARRVAYLPSNPTLPFPLTIAELVDQARPDAGARDDAMDRMELRALEHVPLTRLSTGEARRAWLAMTLSRRTSVLLLDEPLSGLDPRYQMRLLDALTARARDAATVAIVAHDLPYASRVDRVIALGVNDDGAGEVRADGAPLEVLRPDVLRALYGVDVWLGTDPDTGAVFPLPTRAV